MNAPNAEQPACFLCGNTTATLVTDIRRRPQRETDFGIAVEAYARQVYQCATCHVYFNAQHMLQPEIYTRAYNEATYSQKLLETFTRIRQLPLEKSDNKQRVQRVMDFNARQGRQPAQTSVLDVGSGLAVFPAELKDHGFRCHCIDPDPLSAQHAMQHARADGAHAGTLDDYSPTERFEIITFNKVLEHVPNPVAVLKQAQRLLAPGGFIYLELPDGEVALRQGNAIDREEFYIEHFTIFSPAALDYLARAAHLRALETQAIHEPSDKYTLFAFLEPL